MLYDTSSELFKRKLRGTALAAKNSKTAPAPPPPPPPPPPQTR